LHTKFFTQNFQRYILCTAACGSVVFAAICYKPEGSGFKTRPDNTILIIYLGFAQPLTEMSTTAGIQMFQGSREQPMHEVDNLTAMSECTV
jgi:hypothetical protein